jgi:hypothetical protein
MRRSNFKPATVDWANVGLTAGRSQTDDYLHDNEKPALHFTGSLHKEKELVEFMQVFLRHLTIARSFKL